MDPIYLTHPVTAESKAEARKQGRRIIDAVFAPPEAPIYDGQDGSIVREGGEAPQPLTDEPPNREAIATMKRDAVLAQFEARGLEKPKGKIEELRAALVVTLYGEE